MLGFFRQRTTATAREAAGRGRLECMMREHFDAVWRSARRLGMDAGRAEDISQQAFLVAASKLEDIVVGKEKAYLLGVVARLCSDARKHVYYARSSSLDAPCAQTPRASTLSPEQQVSRTQALELLDSALSELDYELREVFVLSQVEEMTMAEIAEQLAIPSGTVASRLRRARVALSDALLAIMPEEERASWMRLVSGEVLP